MSASPSAPYRGRIAPSPTGLMHLGHARTFWTAYERARQAGGTLVFRNEDLDPQRSKPEFLAACMEDLRWFGIHWQEGPDVGGPFAPYSQSERFALYGVALKQLQEGGFIYPCTCSRQDVLRALGAPHQGEEEPVYPGTCRPAKRVGYNDQRDLQKLGKVHWRFRVTDGEVVSFLDRGRGRQRFVAGKDFGDFVVWRQDGVPSYQLAVVVDDAEMRITEVVRGEDLLLSTARQILLYRALGLNSPDYYHCPLVRDEQGNRLAKRHDAMSLATWRERGDSPESLRS